MKPIAIIGGGITGLTAAFRLQEQGLPVALFEAGPRVGGVIQSIRKEGFLAEVGPNSILETSPVITQLIKDLNLESRQVYSDPRSEKRFIVRYRRPIAMPDSPLGFLRTPLFSARAKMRLCAEPFIRRSPAGEEETLAAFVERRLGREFLDYAINPFVGGVYAGNPAQLSVRQAFPKLHALEQKYGSLIKGQILGARERRRSGTVSKASAPKFSFDEGLQVLIDALESRLAGQIETSSAVRKISRLGDDWLLTVANESGEKRVACSAVVLALPAHKLAALRIEAPAMPDISRLSEVYYPPVACVMLGFHRDAVAHPLDGFGMLIPELEGCNTLGALFSSTLFPGRAPKGEVAITCFIGGARAPSLALNNPELLEHLAVQDLTELLGVKGEPTFCHVAIHRKAIPQYNLGYGFFKNLMAEIEVKAPGIFVAGHARDGISLGDSLLSGHGIADRISTFVSASGRQSLAAEIQNSL